MEYLGRRSYFDAKGVPFRVRPNLNWYPGSYRPDRFCSRFDNRLETDALPSLIQSVYQSLVRAGHIQAPPAAALTPAVPVKKSVFPDYIVCLEDGKKLKMLKRHLKASYGLTPEAYRSKWGLPSEYPMVAPNYAAKRSSLAKENGLGRKPAEATAEPAEPEVMALPARRARGSKG